MTKDIEILLELLWYFKLIIVSAILHESGHYLLAKYYKLEPKIKIYGQNLAVVHKGTDDKKNLSILFTGIIVGLIYILYNIKNAPFADMNIMIILAYFFACSSDILQIYYFIFRKPENTGIK
jgi:hypothetical protein